MAGTNLKDEEEVKDNLENLWFGCYHENKPEECHLLGDFFEAIKHDFEKAGNLYSVNCNENKWAHSCFKFGNYMLGGKGSVKKDHVKATEYYEKSCELEHPEGCLHAGLMRTADASKFLRDKGKGLEHFQRGCHLNSGKSCLYASLFHIAGITNVIDRDMYEAFYYTEKGCDLANVEACSNLAIMYEKGDGCPKDSAKAEKYRKRAQEIKDQYTDRRTSPNPV